MSESSDLDARVLAALQGFACDLAEPHPKGMKLAYGDGSHCVYARAQDEVNADGGKTFGLFAIMRSFGRLKKRGFLQSGPIKGTYLVDMNS